MLFLYVYGKTDYCNYKKKTEFLLNNTFDVGFFFSKHYGMVIAGIYLSPHTTFMHNSRPSNKMEQKHKEPKNGEAPPVHLEVFMILHLGDLTSFLLLDSMKKKNHQYLYDKFLLFASTVQIGICKSRNNTKAIFIFLS